MIITSASSTFLRLTCGSPKSIDKPKDMTLAEIYNYSTTEVKEVRKKIGF